MSLPLLYLTLWEENGCARTEKTGPNGDGGEMHWFSCGGAPAQRRGRIGRTAAQSRHHQDLDDQRVQILRDAHLDLRAGARRHRRAARGNEERCLAQQPVAQRTREGNHRMGRSGHTQYRKKGQCVVGHNEAAVHRRRDC